MAYTESPGRGDDADAAVEDRRDRVLGALADARRRFIFRTLRDERTAVTTDALAARLADSSPDLAVERAAVALQHVHLPKLERAGIVDRDDGDDVRLRDGAQRHVLEAVEGLLDSESVARDD